MKVDPKYLEIVLTEEPFRNCHVCNGAGTKRMEICNTCLGTGKLMNPEYLDACLMLDVELPKTPPRTTAAQLIKTYNFASNYGISPAKLSQILITDEIKDYCKKDAEMYASTMFKHQADLRARQEKLLEPFKSDSRHYNTPIEYDQRASVGDIDRASNVASVSRMRRFKM